MVQQEVLIQYEEKKLLSDLNVTLIFVFLLASVGGETMFYRVQSVEPKDNFILSVLFTDGVKTEYDIRPLFSK